MVSPTVSCCPTSPPRRSAPQSSARPPRPRRRRRWRGPPARARGDRHVRSAPRQGRQGGGRGARRIAHGRGGGGGGCGDALLLRRHQPRPEPLKRRDRGAAVSPVAFGREESARGGGDYAAGDARRGVRQARGRGGGGSRRGPRRGLSSPRIWRDGRISSFPRIAGRTANSSRRAASPLAFADEDVTVALPTVGFAAAAAAGADVDVDMDADEDAFGETPTRQSRYPPSGSGPCPSPRGLPRQVPPPPAGVHHPRPRVSPRRSRRSPRGRSRRPSPRWRRSRRQSPRGERHRIVPSWKRRGPPVKFTTVPVPAFIARDEEEHVGQRKKTSARRRRKTSSEGLQPCHPRRRR